uniref:Uncharacterized protein n=1 Tax=Fagus sylvatica TaxID=28930 RepID=A0A2N9IKK3_FAGSY
MSYQLVRERDWETTNGLLKCHPNVITENITDMGKTLLHIAVLAGHEHIVKGLVEKMSDDDLERTNKFGYTALAETTLVGNLQMAKCMLGRKKNLVSKKSSLKLLPVVLAVFHGHIPLARYLYTHTPLEDLTAENGYNGVRLIIQTMFTREFVVHVQSENPSFTTNVILTETNYDVWSQIMEMQIAGREKLEYLTSKTSPKVTDTSYAKWYAENQKVKGWLLTSMSPEIMKRYLRLPTAREIWTALAKAFYDGADESQLFALNLHLYSR